MIWKGWVRGRESESAAMPSEKVPRPGQESKILTCERNGWEVWSLYASMNGDI